MSLESFFEKKNEAKKKHTQNFDVKLNCIETVSSTVSCF